MGGSYVQQTAPAGVFWIDDIAPLKANPDERLALARKYMPLPAAFREAATALRAMIMDPDRHASAGESLLTELYRTAAQENFLLAPVRLPGVGSSYSVAATIPRHVWQALPMPYASIGYRELPLLNWEDRNWLLVAWGEPDRHSTARAYHEAVWYEYLVRYIKSS
jgi:hypothetical protein